MKRLFASTVLAAGLTLLSVASYGQNPIPITFVPVGIGSSGTYILTQDWTYSWLAGSAINVTASDVTIDLNGYHISFTIPDNQLVGVPAVEQAFSYVSGPYEPFVTSNEKQRWPILLLVLAFALQPNR